MIQDVIAELGIAGFRLVGVVGGVVVGERPVPGMADTFQVCGAWPERDGWHARLHVTQPSAGKYVTARTDEVVYEGGPFAELLEFAFWLGGVCSIPVGPAEVAALGQTNTRQVPAST